MDRKEILNLYNEQERKDSIHPQYRREVAGPVVRHISRDPSRLSFIIYSDLNEDNADQVIQEQVDWYKNRVNGYGLEWKTYAHDQPADLQKRLLAHGFEGEEEEALLLIDLQDCPAVYLEPVTADVRRVIRAGDLRKVANIQEQVYDENFDWLATQLQENITKQPEFWSVYMAYVNDQPACAAWISFPPKSTFAGLWGGATLPEYRKQGLYTAVVAARAQEAVQRGYRFLTVDAGDMSRPILEKRGFQFLTHTTPFTLTTKE